MTINVKPGAIELEITPEKYDIKTQKIRILPWTLKRHERVNFYPSKDKKTFLRISGSDLLEIWLETGETARAFYGIREGVSSVSFSSDGQKILAGSYDGTVKEFDSIKGTCLRVYCGHSGPVRACCYSNDEKSIISASSDETIKEWDVITGRCIKTYRGHSDEVTSVCPGPDGERIFSGSSDRQVKEWDRLTGECLCTRKCNKLNINCIALSPDGKRILAGGYKYGIYGKRQTYYYRMGSR